MNCLVDGFREGGRTTVFKWPEGSEVRIAAAAARTREIMQPLNTWASCGSAGCLPARETT